MIIIGNIYMTFSKRDLWARNDFLFLKEKLLLPTVDDDSMNSKQRNNIILHLTLLFGTFGVEIGQLLKSQLVFEVP